MLNDRDERRRVQDPVPRRVRRVPVGDDRVRRPRAARHDLPRAPRRDVDARPADLGVRRADRLGARAGGAAEGRVQAVPGRADRARGAPEASGVRRRRTARASSATTPTSSCNYETEPGSGIGFLAGWRGKDGDKSHARRAQSAAVGDVREEQLRLPPPAAAVVPVHAQLEPRLHGVGAAHAHAPLRRPDRDPALLGGAAEVPPRRAGQAAGPAAARRICASASRPTSIRCRSTTRRSRAQATDLATLSARRDHAAADGDVPLVGFAERVAAPDPRAQLPVRQSAHRARARASTTAAGCGSSRSGARCAACARYQRGGRARHGVDLERDRQGARARGASRPTRTSRSAASC